MRKPRDIDTELKALQDRAKVLKAKRIVQLGELIVATGADSLDFEVLAGALLNGVAEAKVEPTREAWRTDGAAFFQGRGARKSRDAVPHPGQESETGGGDDATR